VDPPEISFRPSTFYVLHQILRFADSAAPFSRSDAGARLLTFLHCFFRFPSGKCGLFFPFLSSLSFFFGNCLKSPWPPSLFPLLLPFGSPRSSLMMVLSFPYACPPRGPACLLVLTWLPLYVPLPPLSAPYRRSPATYLVLFISDARAIDFRGGDMTQRSLLSFRLHLLQGLSSLT